MILIILRNNLLTPEDWLMGLFKWHKTVMPPGMTRRAQVTAFLVCMSNGDGTVTVIFGTKAGSPEFCTLSLRGILSLLPKMKGESTLWQSIQI